LNQAQLYVHPQKTDNMQATLTFNLDDIDDRMAHLRAVKATDLVVALWDIQQFLRNHLKHGDLSDLQQAEGEFIREKINETLNDHNICLDELLQ
jgi:hypothetical protein